MKQNVTKYLTILFFVVMMQLHKYNSSTDFHKFISYD